MTTGTEDWLAREDAHAKDAVFALMREERNRLVVSWHQLAPPHDLSRSPFSGPARSFYRLPDMTAECREFFWRGHFLGTTADPMALIVGRFHAVDPRGFKDALDRHVRHVAAATDDLAGGAEGGLLAELIRLREELPPPVAALIAGVLDRAEKAPARSASERERPLSPGPWGV